MSSSNIFLKYRIPVIVLTVLYLLWIVNALTGLFSNIVLSQKEAFVIEYGEDSKIYERFVYELIFKTKSPVVWERKLAAKELSHLEASPDIQNALEQLLKDKHYVVRREAAIALVKIGKPSPEVIEIITSIVKNSVSHDKFVAIHMLGLLGKDAQSAIGMLEEELKKEHKFDEEIKSEIRKALRKIRG